MSLWNFLKHRQEQKTIQKVLDNRTKVLEMIDSSYTIMGNETLREQLLQKVDNDLKEVLNHYKTQL